MASRGFGCFEIYELPSPRVAVALWQSAAKGLHQVCTSTSKGSRNSMGEYAVEYMKIPLENILWLWAFINCFQALTWLRCFLPPAVCVHDRSWLPFSLVTVGICSGKGSLQAISPLEPCFYNTNQLTCCHKTWVLAVQDLVDAQTLDILSHGSFLMCSAAGVLRCS